MQFVVVSGFDSNSISRSMVFAVGTEEVSTQQMMMIVDTARAAGLVTMVRPKIVDPPSDNGIKLIA